MQRFNKAVALLLCMVMMIGFMPVSAIAADAAGNPTIVIAGSDFQNSGGDTAGGKTVTSIMNQMGYSSVDGVLFGGDYSYSMSTSSNLTNLDGYLDDYCATAANRIYIQGNHDTNLSPSDSSNLLATEGGHDPEGGAYGVYAINHEDFPWSGSSRTLVQGTADQLQEYLDEKADANYTKPIFVMSHLPLHYTNRGDNDYANLLFDVLNSYDELNIIFLFGHNHSTAYDSYLGQGSIYLKKGDAIKVAKDDAKSYNDETLNFTYMNYGYTGYIGSTNADATLTMTAFEIYEDEVIVKRYSTSGQHTLKAAGGNTELPSGVSVNSDVYGQAAINLSTGESTISEISADSGNDDSGSNGGTTGGSGSGSYTYELVTSIEAGEKYVIVGNDDAVALMDSNGSFDSQTVTISGTTLTSDVALTEWTISGTDNGTIISDAGNQLGYNNSAWGLVTGGTVEFDITANSGNFKMQMQRGYNNYNFYYDGTDWTDKSTSDQYVRLYKLTGSGSGGGSTVTPEGGDWVTISSGEGGTIYTLDTDGVSTGENYLIVSAGADGTAQALRNNNGTVASAEVTISNGQIVTGETDVVWTYDTSEYLTNGSHSFYLSYNNTTSFLSTSEKRAVAISAIDQEKGSYSVKRDGSYAYYLNYSEADGWTNSGQNGSAQAIYFFVESGTAAAGDAEYAKLDGELTYTVSRGASAEEALAAVKEGIDVVVSSDQSAETILDDGDENITWTMSGYDGTVAGEYAVTISYKGVKLGTAKVIVPEVTITGYDCQTSGSVKVGATGNVRTGANITVNLEDGTSYTVPVTMNMLTKDGEKITATEGGEITGLTVTYNGVVVCENFTLTVREPSSYPEYPDEGAVKVKKTGTGIQFQSTGVAQVEISASGIPMNQGVDILLILDTSSSMGFQGSLTSGTRIGVLRDCVDALIQNLKKERADGSVPDVDIAIADFAGYLLGHNGTKKNNYISEQVKSTDAEDVGAVLTDGWVSVQNLDDNWGTQSGKITQKSGTNYDHGLEQAYNLLLEKQQQDNGTRKQFVLFMSDGAPLQYNGVNSNSLGTDWEKWILGSYTQAEVDAMSRAVDPDNGTLDNPEFYYGNNNGNGQKHWVAEAIKGSPNETYPIVYHENYTYGEATMAMKEVSGLGATMYTVGLALEATNMPTDVAGQAAILKTIASNEDIAYNVTSAEGLQEAFDDFAGEALMSATNARFVDQMGDAYDLQMGDILDLNDKPIDVENKIEILSYDIWTRSDYLAGKCTADKIGDRKGTYTVLETITFNADGTEAYSSKVSTGPNGETIAAGSNILIGGVIYAQSFWYNSNHTAAEITGVDIPTGMDSTTNLTTGSTNMLPAETFYWKVGTIKTTELAMRYYVYLTGSMEGTREAGSYPTNNYANLYYNNYLNQPTGQPCHMDTVSPVLAWEAANVSYAFYLVDEKGNIIVNQTTGETGSFANKIAVTNPVVYEEVLLNNTDTVESIEVASSGVLPTGYELYDPAAVYTIEINSDATGSWTIAKGDDKVASTYVTQYDPGNAAAYSSELTKNSDADFTHTVVWFAVLWKVQALPDTVVIDYGLPVDISVLANDMFGENGKLVAVGSAEGVNLDVHGTALHANFLTNGQPKNSYQAEYGTAQVNANGKVRYTPSTMEMNGYDKFAYAVNYTGATNPGYYYDTVTVIPATTIYYEDSFLTFAKYNADGTVSGTWDFAGEAVEGATQSEDRPGQYSLTDANNIYGYDGVNLGMSQFSLGQARKVHVDANSYATAAFTFYGTGFDVISMTSNTSGVLSVEVKDQSGASVKKAIVNTYYGYTVDENGKWIPAPDVENSIYQVPVIQIEELNYGKYDVLITATYMSPMDKTTVDGYDLYLDAIRIYDPACGGASDGAEDSTIEDAYLADHEGWPSYIELRNGLISKSTLGNADTAEKLVGEVFIDGDSKVGDAQIADYVSYGPNNEVYLASGQSIAFIVNAPENIDRIHIGVSSADGNEGTYTIKNIARYENTDSGIKAGQTYGEKTYTVNTSTDMYYDMTGWKNDIVVISNTGNSGIISLTNIKSTYISNPADNVTTIPGTEAQTVELNDSPLLRMAAAPLAVNAEQETTAPAEIVETAEPELTYVYMTAEAAQLVLTNLNADAEEIPDETEPEETEPTVPDETEPEETEPTVPNETEPEETEPTVPEETEPEVFEPAYVHVKLNKTSIKVGQKVLVTVTTSADVDHVIINGTVVTAYTTGSTGNRIWKRNVTGTVAGTLMIDVTCCNASDVAAQTVTRQVKVSNKTIWDYIFDLFD